MYELNTPTMNEDARRAVASLLGGHLADTKALYEMQHKGIRGLSRRIKLPESEYDENGNGYSEDFPSFYQTEGVKFLMDNHRVLIADEMGVGKTAQAVAGKLEIENRTGRKAKTLVITPDPVKSHWDKEIDKYCERKQRAVVLDSYSEQSLRNAEGADFTIVNYNIFSQNEGNGRVAKNLIAQNFDYVILDEVHNVKNPKAFNPRLKKPKSGFRSKPIKQIADSAEYLCLLSGTPIPNSLQDTYMLISMLEKDAYPTPEDVRKAHWDQPRLIRAILQRKRLKRETKDAGIELPPIKGDEIPSSGILELGQAQRELYTAIYENDELDGMKKLQELRKSLLDPKLVDPKVIADEGIRARLKEIPSAKYEALERIVAERAGKEKIVIFSPQYMTGVTKELEKMLEQYGALRIDGSVTNGEKKRVRERFQTEDDKRVLITNKTSGEGISLVAGSTVILLDEPYTPAERRQYITRVYRRGQKKEVDIISLTVKDSIDEGVLQLLKQKQEGIDFIEKGRELKPEHIEALMREHVRTTPISRRLYTPQQRVMRLSLGMHDQGSEKNLRALSRRDGKIGKDYAQSYCEGWETSYSANVARAYKPIIDALQTKTDLKRKLDIGSAFGVLSHITGEKTTNVDLNKYHFESKLSNPDNANIVASMHSLPLQDSSFDLAVSSLSLNFTSNESKNGRSEREATVREANRVLRQGGHYIVTLPYNLVTQEKADDIKHGLGRLGFEVVPELTGFVQSSGPDMKVFIAVGKKTGEPSSQTNGEEFRLKMRDKKLYATRKKGIAHEFSYFNPETGKEENMEERLGRAL